MILTIQETMSWAIDVLSSAKIESPRVDAEIILCHFTLLKRADLYSEPAREIDDETLAGIREAVTRRTSGDPVQYVVGETQFLSHRIAVGPGVLIPRPETEQLAMEGISFLKSALQRTPPWGPPEPLAADIGTGSGAIAVAIAMELPELTVYATDTSPEALETATANAFDCGVSDRVVVLEGSMLEPLAKKSLDGKLAAVISNPPYVSSSQWRTLPFHIKECEPKEALLAGEDGLDFIRRLIADAPAVLAPGGLLAFEMGAWQWPSIAKLLDRQHGLGCFRVLRDLAGYERIATAIRI